jgi:hypothetical protein
VRVSRLVGKKGKTGEWSDWVARSDLNVYQSTSLTPILPRPSNTATNPTTAYVCVGATVNAGFAVGATSDTVPSKNNFDWVSPFSGRFATVLYDGDGNVKGVAPTTTTQTTYTGALTTSCWNSFRQ